MNDIIKRTGRGFIQMLSTLLLLGTAIAQEQTAASEKKDLPKASVQIVNAISAPKVALSVNGKDLYPDFPQALYTADAPLPELKPRYQVTDPDSKLTSEFRAELEPNTNQSLVMIGNFSVPEDPSLYLPGILKDAGQDKAVSTATEGSKPKPNILFLLFNHKISQEETPLRYRVVNGMIGVPLVLDAGKSGKITVEPGEFHSLQSQQPVTTLSVTVQNKPYPVFINQQGLQRNALIIFYQTAEGPAFMRAFENSKETFKVMEDLEAAESATPALPPETSP